MSASLERLALAPRPQSAREARSWIAAQLVDLGREDLVDSARLGVTELISNVVLHTAASELVVTVRGTSTHPRIEVHDDSADPPRPPPRAAAPTDDISALATYGRGLSLVAAHSVAWGTHIDDHGRGKLLWFEPAPEATERVPIADVFSLDEAMAEVEPPEQTIVVELIGMPVQEFHELRTYYNDLRRELRLLALAHPGEYPLAVAFSEVSMQVERERRVAVGVDTLEEALRTGRDRADLSYSVPTSAATSMRRLNELLDQLPEQFTEDKLLSRPLTERQHRLQHWYLGQFVEQADGQDATPWPGGYDPT